MSEICAICRTAGGLNLKAGECKQAECCRALVHNQCMRDMDTEEPNWLQTGSCPFCQTLEYPERCMVEFQYSTSRRQEIQAQRSRRAEINTARQWLEKIERKYNRFLDWQDRYVQAAHEHKRLEKKLDRRRELNLELWKFSKLAREEQQAYLFRDNAEINAMQEQIYRRDLEPNR